jgi:DNA polymerase III delta prime subunit
MNELENLIWELKYRPKKIDDVILPESVKSTIKAQLVSGKVPNYLFSGPPGIGKTTLAYVIAEELDADVLFVNASLDCNIDTLRTKITQFVSTVSFTNSRKIVVLDESDHLSSTVQPALRNFTDSFSDNAIFILTANYPDRIIQPLQSRLTRIDFKFNKTEKQAAAMQMLKRSCEILEIEDIKYDKKSVAGLVSKNFPDLRRVIKDLQLYSSSGEIDSGILATIDESGLLELIAAIKEKNFTNCRKWIAQNQIDSQQFYRMFYDKVSLLLEPKSIPQLILLIAESQFKSTHSVDQEINQIAFIITVMQQCIFK